MTMRWIAGGVVCGVALMVALPAAAASPFFTTANQSAFARSFLLPALGESQIVTDSDWSWRAQIDQTNDYHTETVGTETLTADGESTRLGYTLTAGFGNGFEFGFEVPLYIQSHGFMDRFIEDWHRWFGLPNGGREFAAQDQYLFEVKRGASVSYRNTRTGYAFGDLRINGAWQANEHVALRLSVQLPTGNEDKLAGGNLGGALWADMALPFAADSSWRGFVSLGGTVADRGDVLPDLQQRVAGLGGFGLSYGFTDRFRLTAQLQAHSSLYKDTELEALKRPGLQAAFGGSYQILPNFLLRLAVQEDPVTASSPDFSVHLGLQLSPQPKS